jgi:thiamine biosynthesis lipoprotein
MLLIISVILTGCVGDSSGSGLSLVGTGSMQSTTLFAMDTVMELEIAGNEALLTQAEDIIRGIEKTLSTTDEDSEIARLNKDGAMQLSGDTAELMKEALEICQKTDGALDITIYPVLRAWGFTTAAYTVPSEEELKELLKHVDYRLVQLELDSNGDGTKSSVADEVGSKCEIPDGTLVDLGSVAKGYTGRKLADFFVENGVQSGLINLGGNVQCIGSKTNGQPWKVAIKSPFKGSSGGIFGVLQASDTSIITSGGYERYFEKNGKTYWHIIDPETGFPADNGVVSVTIVTKDGTMGDGLSTALFVMGLDDAVEYYKENEGFDVIIITKDKEAYISEGIYDKFSLTSEYYDAKLHMISR